MGKRGGTRVIYCNTLAEGSIWLLIAYPEAKFDNLPSAFLKQLKEEISNGQGTGAIPAGFAGFCASNESRQSGSRYRGTAISSL
jgi:hypothetical protein